jgi:hypothetical protein
METCLCQRYGRMVCWNIGNKGRNNLFKLFETLSNPLFHYSIIPIGAKPLSPILIYAIKVYVNLLPEFSYTLDAKSFVIHIIIHFFILQAFFWVGGFFLGRISDGNHRFYV